MLTAVVFLGAGLGGVLRWYVGMAVARWLGASFPWGTLLVNISGSTAMGLFAALFFSRTGEGASYAGIWQTARLFVLTGILGGYTTFSAFSLETIGLWEREEYFAAAGYCVSSVVLSFTGLVIGLLIARSLG